MAALKMMLLGLALAAGPLAWVWLRHRTKQTQRLKALTLLTLFLTFDLVLFGAFTRLTDSGLGCPDWPGCYNQATPLGAHQDIAAAQAELPSGPVTPIKAWIEMIHRYLATAVGVLILVMAVESWRTYFKNRSHRPWWATLTLVWVCVQGAFGALTVTMKLFPAIVTLHLLGGLALLALLTRQAVSLYVQAQDTPTQTQSAASKLAIWSLGLLVVQIALGGWVSTNYAVLACTEFPMCQNSWWPDMNFAQGFEFWRELGMTQTGDHITFAALTAIHMVHRWVALVVFAVLALLAYTWWKQSDQQKWARALVGLMCLQFLTGLSNVVLSWPLLSAVMHTGGAAALVLLLVAAMSWPTSTPGPVTGVKPQRLGTSAYSES